MAGQSPTDSLEKMKASTENRSFFSHSRLYQKHAGIAKGTIQHLKSSCSSFRHTADSGKKQGRS